MCYLDRTFLMLLTRAHIGGCAKNHCESIMKPDLPGSLRTKLLAIVLVTTLVALIVALCAIVGYDVRLYQEAWVADMADGFFRYVTKPLVLDELNDAIDTALAFSRSAETQSE